ncbi:MAG TPA: hypothetical protein VG937_00230 [Polyangiaceae bacterium]|nr:hypothetical protein [Polyangiaceae bacterium]
MTPTTPMTPMTPMTALQRVAAIVIPNCAVAGCHDAVSKTHGMDLSTAENIRAMWVNQRGFDHCTGLDTPRVIPGNPAGSLVMTKIEAASVCSLGQPMPPPPKPLLTADQIAVIRAWIAGGALSDTPAPTDGGSGDGGGQTDPAVRDAGAGDAAMDEAGAGDAGADDAGAGDAGADDGMPTCSSANPCEVGLTCSGQTCGDAWHCVSHFDEVLEHPCADDPVKFCGCDGVTFEASVTCPDRPWSHVGACDDGVSCTKDMIECSDPQPDCPAGQEPSVVGTCWGPCVPLASCRCLYHWMCPHLEVNTCLADYRCGPNPNLADAGAEAGAP